MAYSGTCTLKILHPGATGLCFIMKFRLVTLIGLTNSLSTSNFSEMIKKRACIHDQGSKSTADLCFAWQGIQPTVLQFFLRYSFSRDLQCTSQQLRSKQNSHAMPVRRVKMYYEYFKLGAVYQMHQTIHQMHKMIYCMHRTIYGIHQMIYWIIKWFIECIKWLIECIKWSMQTKHAHETLIY